ncbi:short chain dehydrogenase, partial [Calycina marina]
TRSDAIDYLKGGIGVNCVCLGPIEWAIYYPPVLIRTPMTARDPAKLEQLKPAVAVTPMDRWGTTQEIADACLYLCSSKATLCQGAAFVNFEASELHSWLT